MIFLDWIELGYREQADIFRKQIGPSKFGVAIWKSLFQIPDLLIFEDFITSFGSFHCSEFFVSFLCFQSFIYDISGLIYIHVFMYKRKIYLLYPHHNGSVLLKRESVFCNLKIPSSVGLLKASEDLDCTRPAREYHFFGIRYSFWYEGFGTR